MGLKQGAIENTLGEHIGNLMEHIRTSKGHMLGIPHPKLKRKKNKALWVHAEPSAWNFYFQNYSSTFFAQTNTSIRNWGYICIYLHYLQHFKVVCWMWTFCEKKCLMWCWTYQNYYVRLLISGVTLLHYLWLMFNSFQIMGTTPFFHRLFWVLKEFTHGRGPTCL